MKNLLIIFFAFINLIASATDYYVSSTGSDSNNGLSSSAPWKTIAKVNSMSFLPGDRIYFNRGNVWKETLTVPTSGNSSASITFSSYGTGANPVIDANKTLDRCITITGRSYITIDGVDCKNANVYGIVAYSSPGTHIIIRNLTISSIGSGDAEQVGIYQEGGYLTVDNCVLTDISQNAIQFGGGHCIITFNKISYANARSTGWGGAIAGSGDSDEIANNTISNCGGVGEAGLTHGIYIGTSSTNTNIHHNVITGSSRGSGIKTNGGGNFHHNHVSGSYLSGIETGFNSTNAATINIYYNIFNGNRAGISESSQGTGAFTLHIYNNTFYCNNSTQEDPYYSELTLGDNINTSLVIKNNILYGYDRYTFSFTTLQSHAVINNNCIFGTSTNLVYYNGSAHNWSYWKGLGFDINGINADPKLSNPTTDFHLNSGSPAIDAGTSVALETDYDGVVVSNPPDIGAFEKSSTSIAIPQYTSSVIENATPAKLEMTYNITLANIVPAAGSFSVLVNSSSRTVSTVTITGTKVLLTLASPIFYGDIVKVSYTKPSSNAIQTSAGGQAASVSAQAVTNNVSPTIPVYTSAVIANSTPSLLEMTYSMVLANIVPATGSFSVLVNSAARTVSSVVISGTKVQLTLASPVLCGDVVIVSYAKPSGNPLQTSSGGQAASISAQAVTNNVSPVIPVYTSSLIANSTPSLLEMTYSIALANVVPATGSFSVLVNSVARTVSSVVITGTKVQLTIASPVVNGDVVKVSYTKPSVNPLQTSAGGQAVSISAQAVTNNVSPVIPVYTSSAIANSTPSLLEMTYSIALANVVPAAGSFSILVNSAARAVSSVVITGAKVQLTVASPVVNGDVVKISYTKPSVNPLQTAAGGQAASISAQTVTNNVSPVIPVYTSSAIANSTPSLLEMTYSMTLANIVPAASSFSVLVNSVARTVGSVAISGTKVQLTLSSPVINGDVVKVSYTRPSTNPLQTTAGGQAASVSSQSVTNGVNPAAPAVPVYTSSVIANSTPSRLDMTYSITLANIVPAASSFSVLVNSASRTINTVVISGTKVQLTLSSPVVYGDVVKITYNKPSVNPLQTAAGGQAISVSTQPVTNNVALVIPVYTSSVVANSTPSLLEMTYNMTLANKVPAAGSFSVRVNSATRTVNSVVIEGTKVQLTLSSPVVYGDVVTVTYTKPALNPLQTTAGGQAASVTAQQVTNNVNSPVLVYSSSVIANSTPSLLEMVYSMTLANITPSAGSFSVLVNSEARAVSSVVISDTKVQLTLESPVLYGDVVTVAYSKPSVNPIQTPAGGQAGSISAKPVTNSINSLIPVFTGAVVADSTPSSLEMSYSMSLADKIPASGSFSVIVNSAARAVSDVTISGSTVILTLETPIVSGDAVTISYTGPSANPLQNNTGGQAASITNQPVVNNCVDIVPDTEITFPLNSSSFLTGSDITIIAEASDVDGSISMVEYYSGDTKIGESASAPYSFTWNDVADGNYILTVIATDNLNEKARSSEVTISVGNQPPAVKITNPNKGGGKVKKNSTITVQAIASDADGTIKSVSFFEGTNKLTELTSPPYEYTWKDIGVGTYSITAVATDNFNASSTSAPVVLIVENGGIYDAKSDIIKLYPNPSDGHFSIEFVNPLQNENSTIVITDLEGKQIYTGSIAKEETLKHFDLSDPKSGIYVMLLKDKQIFVTKKFFIR